VLDVTFREDESRIRTGYAPENFNIFRQLGINMSHLRCKITD
jgi:predicted transposase YbfD/YdcC